MTNRFPVLNISRGYNVRYKQALKSIEACSCAWVEEGISIRDLTLAEAIHARNEQAKMREPLEYAELPGLVFRPPLGAEKSNATSGVLVFEAHRFARENAA